MIRGYANYLWTITFLIIAFLFLSIIFFTPIGSFSFTLFLMVGVIILAGLLGLLFYTYNKLATSHSILLNSADSFAHGVCLIDETNKVRFKNQPFELFFQDNLKHYLDFKRIMKQAAQEARLGKMNDKVLPIILPDKTKIVYRMTTASLNHYPGYVGFTFSNITALQAPQEDNSKIISFLDHAALGIYSIDSTGKILYANHTFQEWTLKDTEKPKNLFERLDDSKDKDMLFPKAIKPDKIYEHHFSIDNTFYRSFQKFIPIGKNAYNSCSIIFKSKRQRHTARTDIQKIKSAFEEAPAGIVVVDDKANILCANNWFTQLIHKNYEDIHQTNISELIHLTYRKTILKNIKNILQNRSAASSMDASFLGAKIESLAVYMSPYIEKDQTIGVILLFIDAREQRKKELQFIHSQRMQAVGQLAGGVAHDFNNLLTAMIGFCDLLLQRYSPSEQSFSDVMQIKQNADRASGLVKQLLAFSRQQSLQPKILNVVENLSDLSVLLRRLLGSGIELKVRHMRGLWDIKVDQGQFEQVIINLAVNARDAMQNKGILKITTENFHNDQDLQQNHETVPQGEYVLIKVIDQGSGIPPEIVDRIFEPFFSTKEMGAGTGLGLATVYGIIKQTEGFIFVNSPPKKGTEFSIFIPRYQEEDTSTNLRPDIKIVKDLTGSANILVVEDEDAIRMFMSRALKDKGYNVIESSNGDDAIQILKTDQPQLDLIITDVVMPTMDGPQMINEIRTFMPEVKVIFISGYAEDSFRKKLDDETQIHFLQKPFNLKDLAIKVKDILS